MGSLRKIVVQFEFGWIRKGIEGPLNTRVCKGGCPRLFVGRITVDAGTQFCQACS